MVFSMALLLFPRMVCPSQSPSSHRNKSLLNLLSVPPINFTPIFLFKVSNKKQRNNMKRSPLFPANLETPTWRNFDDQYSKREPKNNCTARVLIPQLKFWREQPERLQAESSSFFQEFSLRDVINVFRWDYSSLTMFFSFFLLSFLVITYNYKWP